MAVARKRQPYRGAPGRRRTGDAGCAAHSVATSVLAIRTILSKCVHTPSSASAIILASRNVSCEQFRTRSQNHLRHLEGLGGVAFLDLLREAVREIWLVLEMREMDGEGVGKRPHPIGRHHLDRAPRAERLGVEFRRQPHKVRCFGFEIVAELTGFPELLVVEQALCANAAEMPWSAGNDGYRHLQVRHRR